MYCIYCGQKTDNPNNICDNCAAERAQSSQAQTQENQVNPVWQPAYTTNQPAGSGLIRALADAMSSKPALITAILLSLNVLFVILAPQADSESSRFIADLSTIITRLFTAGLLSALLAASAWISYTSAKKSKETGMFPSTTGLSIASVIGVIYIVLFSILIALFLFLLLLVLSLNNEQWILDNLEESFSLYGPLLSFVMSFFSAVLVVAMFAFAFVIVVYVLHRKNLKMMRNVLNGTERSPKLMLFPIVILFITAAINLIGAIDLAVSAGIVQGNNFLQLSAPAMLSNAVVAAWGSATQLFAGLSLLKCRAALRDAQED